MNHWDTIRGRARARRAEVDRLHGSDPSAHAVLEGAERLTGLRCEGRPAGDVLLFGADAVLDRAYDTIWFNQALDPRVSLFYQAHEFAHFWLHSEQPTPCQGSDLDAEAVEEPALLGARRVEGYSPHERREREANVFATEFLLPTDLLRRWYAEEGLDAPVIVERTGLPSSMVLHQLARALLTPDTLAADPREEAALLNQTADLHLDPSQVAAAHAARGPLLVEAGPGTGKTRALVGRVLSLLRQGADPRSILALTFSNKAAEEMRDRVARVAPEAARHIWMGTFHAFGLELLRKEGTGIGLPPKPVVLDPVDAFALLEEGLADLQLDHYSNLYEPTIHLRDILGAISRAKDEHRTPEDYRVLAETMRAATTDPDEVERAERAMEVARVYAWYQARMEERGQVDFGDLIARSVDLLREHPPVRARLRRQYRHILVDEYQDVNRASGLLLQELAGDGRGLWVVGDARQAIYRFRGAAPTNMERFREDFPGATVLSLQRNYRSQPAIVSAFAALAPRMRAAKADAFAQWEAIRSDQGGQVLVEIAEDREAEGDGIAREIERQRTAGIPYRDQAVLCRSHKALADVAARLERAGVPSLYLGDLFERPEVRDLLSLVSLACDSNGRGLVRVAQFSDYQVPLADVRSLIALAREREATFPAALALAEEESSLSETGRAGLARLSRHLDGLVEPSTDAWWFLVRYLFERSNFIRHLLADETIAGQQKRIALYQFLQFAHEHRRSAPADGVDPKRAFLQSVRRLEILGDEVALRHVPEWASGLDAVRLMTVHASKGLEFRAVYVPTLARGKFPASWRGQACPPPTGMVSEDPKAAHLEEEECLFFVALSRARDVLCVSRALKYGEQKRGASDFLQQIGYSGDGPVTWPSGNQEPTVAPPLSAIRGPKPTFAVRMLDLYRNCGRKYHYAYALGLDGNGEDSAYVQFHRCVYAVLRWLREERIADRATDTRAALAQMDEIWMADGPRGHLHEAEYRRIAEGMVAGAVDRAAGGGRLIDPNWQVSLTHGQVRFRPDQVEVLEDGTVVVRRLRTGRPTDKDGKEDIYALYQVAAAEAFPGARIRIETLYLSTGETREVRLSEKEVSTRLNHYDKVIAGIRRGEFAANLSSRDCPRCPYYFICPTGEGA